VISSSVFTFPNDQDHKAAILRGVMVKAHQTSRSRHRCSSFAVLTRREGHHVAGSAARDTLERTEVVGDMVRNGLKRPTPLRARCVRTHASPDHGPDASMASKMASSQAALVGIRHSPASLKVF
jgi:hypothetical protein